MPVKATSLVAALGSAARHAAAGSVVSRAKGIERRIWVKDGRIVFAESADPSESFGAILAFRGIILEKERMAMAAVAQPGLREDLAMAASGLLGPVEVMEHARVVLEERLAIDFGIAGPIWVAEGKAPPEDLPNVGTPIAVALLEGVRKLPPERLRLEFPVGPDDVYVFRSGVLAAHPELNLSKDEVRLTAVLDGKRRWTDALAASKVEPDAAHAALYAITILGIVEFVSAAAGGPSPVPETAPPPPAAAAGPAVNVSFAAGKGAEMAERAGKAIPELLDIPPEAASEVVEDAFRLLVAQYDLGRAHFLPEADRNAAILLLDRAIEGYLALTGTDSRKEYFAAPEPDREAVLSSIVAPLSAEKGYVKAGIFLQAGNYLAAEAALLPAIQANPRDGRFHLRMGIAIYLRSKSRGVSEAPAGALRALQKAIALDPRCDEAFLYLGHIAMAAGDKYGAKTYYETALTLNPSSGEARRAIMRAENA